MANKQIYIPLPSASRPWFLIPADDPGAFFYFVKYMLSSRKRKQRWIINVLKICVSCGGHKLWPLLAKVYICFASAGIGILGKKSALQSTRLNM